jgi:hypothetical protein
MRPLARLGVLLLLLLPALGSATMQLRNLSVSPAFICPGQKITVNFEAIWSINAGDQFWSYIQIGASQWYILDSTHPNNGTAATNPGVPAGATTVQLPGGASDGFWHPLSFVTTIPAGFTGTGVASLVLKGLDGGLNFITASPDATQTTGTEITCTKKAVVNTGSLWEQSSSATLIIQNSCGTPSNTPTFTHTPTRSVTPTVTPTRTPTSTPSATATITSSLTVTSTRTSTLTPSPTSSPTFSPSPPFTATDTATVTPTFTYSETPTVTPTRTSTATPSVTLTPSPSFTESDTRTLTATPSLTSTDTPSQTITPIYSATNTPSSTWTPTVTPSATETVTFSPSPTLTDTPTATPSATATRTFSFTDTATPSLTQTLTYTDSPTFTVSPTITETPVPVPFQVRVILYNAAGERVRLLYDGSAARLPNDVPLDRTVMTSGVDTLHLDMGGALSGGGTLLSWHGENDSGQIVKGGAYYFKVEYKDPFGTTTSFTKGVQVLEGKAGNRLDLYNSAGELVQRLDFSGLSQSVTGFSLAHDSFAEAFKADGSAEDPLAIKLTLSDGTTVTIGWDGRGMDGQPVAAGSYTAVLVSDTPTGTLVSSKSVTVIRGDSLALSREPILAPNPVRSTDGSAPWVEVDYPAGELQGARFQVYNQAGERVGDAADRMAAGKVGFQFNQAAGGVYIVVFEGRRLDGSLYRRVLKAAVVR